MEQELYGSVRDNIKSGDLLIWGKNKLSPISNTLLHLIRILTLSDYAQVGIAWRIGGRLFVVEATIPEIRVTTVSNLEEFYYVNMNIEFTDSLRDWLLDKVGLKYSFKDALRACFGKTCVNDDRWQCAELANHFYKLSGKDFGTAYTPGQLVYAATEAPGNSIVRVVALK